jgi:hypothetical protein
MPQSNHYLAFLQHGLADLGAQEREEFFLSVLYYLENLSSTKQTIDNENLTSFEQILAGIYVPIPARVACLKLLEMLICNMPNLSNAQIKKMFKNIMDYTAEIVPASNVFKTTNTQRALTFLSIFLIWEIIFLLQIAYSFRNNDKSFVDFINQIQKLYHLMLLGGLLMTTIITTFFPFVAYHPFRNDLTQAELLQRIETGGINAGLDAVAETTTLVINFSKASMAKWYSKFNHENFSLFVENAKKQYDSFPDNYLHSPESSYLTTLEEFLTCAKTHGIKQNPPIPSSSDKPKVD